MPVDTTPRNRLEQELDILRIEVEHAGGLLVLDPNKSIMLAVGSPQEVLTLGPLPDKKSVISAEPAVIYRAGNVEVPLDPAELLRLMTTSLQPDEFFRLMEVYGSAFEWHDDFYDFETGEALQPRLPRQAPAFGSR